MLRTFAYVRPGSVSEALKQIEEPGARIHCRVEGQHRTGRSGGEIFGAG